MRVWQREIAPLNSSPLTAAFAQSPSNFTAVKNTGNPAVHRKLPGFILLKHPLRANHAEKLPSEHRVPLIPDADIGADDLAAERG